MTTKTMRNALGQGLVVLGLWLGVATASQAVETVVYYHTDALGSPVAKTDAGGNVIERSEYEPFGRLLNRPLEDGPGYTGHVSDAATGLSYMQQRYYDPEVGRFLSVDPVSANSGVGFNRYSYAANNPFRYYDPDGRSPQTSSGSGSGSSGQDCDAECNRRRQEERDRRRNSPFTGNSPSSQTGYQEPSISGFIKQDGLTVLSRTASVVGGAGQVVLGGITCVGVVTCVAGGALATQGASNVYEGWTGKDSPLRALYQKAFGKKGGDIAYAVVDVGTSGYGLMRPVLKPGSWKLFRYTNDQYMPAAKALTGTEAAVEAGNTASDLNNLYQSQEDP